MQIINDNTVVVNNNDELKQVLSEENNYNYVYLGNDITVTSGFVINNKKSKVIIDVIFSFLEFGSFCFGASPKEASCSLQSL